MRRDNAPRTAERRRRREEHREPLPTWRNTRPRGNAEIDRHDLKRSTERFEMLLGR
jgi:hypothetical protein